MKKISETSEPVHARHFRWLLRRRRNGSKDQNGVYYADGRSQGFKPHSLGTKDRAEALRRIHDYDEEMAILRGLIKAPPRIHDEENGLDLDEGIRFYAEHLDRPKDLGGVSPSTAASYRSHLKHFQSFLKSKGVANWKEIDKGLVAKFHDFLKAKGNRPSTIGQKLTTVGVVNHWLIEEKYLSPSCWIKIRVKKSEGVEAYCWKPEEVKAIVSHCRTHSELDWLGDILVALAHTGLRISQLLRLQWKDVFLEDRRIMAPASTNKIKRSFCTAINEELFQILKQRRLRDETHVFTSRDGKELDRKKVYSQFVKKVRKPLADRFLAKDGAKGFSNGTLHTFRHYHCSSLTSKNVPPALVTAMMGHLNSRMTLHYTHLHQEQRQRYVNLLDSIDDQTPTNPTPKPKRKETKKKGASKERTPDSHRGDQSESRRSA